VYTPARPRRLSATEPRAIPVKLDALPSDPQIERLADTMIGAPPAECRLRLIDAKRRPAQSCGIPEPDGTAPSFLDGDSPPRLSHVFSPMW
jgi:hypothetical protein